MSALEESSAATEAASRTTFSPNWTRQAQPLDLSKLSARSRLIRQGIWAEKEEEGVSLRDIASSREKPVSWVLEQLEWLNADNALQMGSLFPLEPEEYQALYDDIKINGVRIPIVVGEHIPIVDGLNRWDIALNLGIEQDVPIIWLHGLSVEEERELGWKLNTLRRQMTSENKRRLVETELLRNWNRSDRLIARVCGVSPTTVGTMRRIVRAENALDASALSDEELAAQDGKELPEVKQKPLLSKLDTRKPEPPQPEPGEVFDWRKHAPEVDQTEDRVDARGRTHTIDITPRATPSKSSEIDNRGPLSKVIEVGLYGHATCGACSRMLDLYWDGTWFKTVALEHE